MFCDSGVLASLQNVEIAPPPWRFFFFFLLLREAIGFKLWNTSHVANWQIIDYWRTKRVFTWDFISDEIRFFQFGVWSISVYMKIHEMKLIGGVILLRSLWQENVLIELLLWYSSCNQKCLMKQNMHLPVFAIPVSNIKLRIFR